MEKIPFSSLGVSLSPLGMGCMRFPTRPDGSIDYEKAQHLIDIVYQGGVNYYDTAYFYHKGESESFLKRALVQRYPRDSFYLADKMPLDRVKNIDDMRALFDTQRERLGVDHIDFYLLHGIDEAAFTRFASMGGPDFIRDLKQTGQVNYLGFSFHGANEQMPRLADAFPWDIVQIQLNYADWYQCDAQFLYDTLHVRHLPIIVMEPVRGGGLAQLPDHMARRLHGLNPEASQASFAIRFCGSLPGVVTLSGMSTPAQALDNLAQFSPLVPLSQEEHEACRWVAKAFDDLPTIPCTACDYCAECPEDIPISKIFSAHTQYVRFSKAWPLVPLFENEGARATHCTRCGLCESRCPQHIEIIEELVRVAQTAAAL